MYYNLTYLPLSVLVIKHLYNYPVSPKWNLRSKYII